MYERKLIENAINQVELEVKHAHSASRSRTEESWRGTRKARGSRVQEEGGRREAEEGMKGAKLGLAARSVETVTMLDGSDFQDQHGRSNSKVVA